MFNHIEVWQPELHQAVIQGISSAVSQQSLQIYFCIIQLISVLDPLFFCQILLTCVGLRIYHHLASCLLEPAQSILSIGGVGNRKINWTKLFR